MSELINKLEDMGYSWSAIQSRLFCRHDIREGICVPINLDKPIYFGRKCKKCGLSGELLDYINKYKPNFMTYEKMLELR